ncbi:hypothetical protein C8R44DRAFT_636057 [Mycena epipterygia]|nr:hypothetical protein C8R44DRAFT_636057 [Mycena epipterygia]
MAFLTLQAGLLQIPAETSLLPEETTYSCLQDAEHTIQNGTSNSEIVYPILTIPPELTTEIFVHCLPGEPSEPSPSVAPMLLGAVCR